MKALSLLGIRFSIIGLRLTALWALTRMTRRLLAVAGYEIQKLPPKSKQYSMLEEQEILRKYVEMLGSETPYCVDIGAGNGRSASNTFAFFQQGWNGLAVECHPARFAQLAGNYRDLTSVALARCRVTPENVCGLLRSFGVPAQFAVLSLDIDSYDYFVLAELLKEFRPSVICAEINEKIPPPIRFTVKWNPEFEWAMDHFYGQSISQLATLCEMYDYALVELHYVNAFLIPREKCPSGSLTAEQAYRTGYADRVDRLQRLPWNADMEPLLTMSTEEALREIDRRFTKYEGQYICTV